MRIKPSYYHRSQTSYRAAVYNRAIVKCDDCRRYARSIGDGFDL